MKNIYNLLLWVSILVGCNNKDVKTVYGPPKIDSNTVFLISVDKEGNVTDTYINDKFLRNDNIVKVSAGVNEDSFYEYSIIESVKYKTSVFKPEYRKEDYFVVINNDSIFLGEVFECTLGFNSEVKYSVEHIDGYEKKEKIEGENKTVILSKKVNNIGIDSIKGKVVLKGETIPFLYNYVILPRQIP